MVINNNTVVRVDTAVEFFVYWVYLVVAIAGPRERQVWRVERFTKTEPLVPQDVSTRRPWRPPADLVHVHLFFTQLWTTYTQPDQSTSDFLTRGGGQSWLRASGEQMDKTPLDCDLFDLIVLFIPVHLGQHWVSIEVHFLTCRIVYMDSFNNNGTDKMNCVFHFLNFMHQQRDGPDSGPLEKQNWSFEHDLVDPQQNASDCGVYQGIRAILSTDPFVQENRFPCVGRRFHFKHTDVSLTSMMHRVVFGWLN
jgi:hypothetical protein